jgi:hypothetical protein
MKPLPAPRPDGVTVVALSAGWLPKLLGLPFLGFGLWLLWQVPVGAYTYWRADALGELLGQIPGLLLAVVFGALFALPGVLLVFGRKKVELDPGRGEVREAIHYGVSTRRTAVPLAELDRVELTAKPDSASGSRPGRPVRWYSHAELKGAGNRVVLLGLDADHAPVRELGRGVAERLGVPLVDRLGD